MKTGLISAFERLDSARKHDPSLGVEMLLRLGGGIAIDDLVVLLGDARLLSAFALHLAVEVATAGRRACFFTCGRPLGATAELVLGMRSGVSLALIAEAP